MKLLPLKVGSAVVRKGYIPDRQIKVYCLKILNNKLKILIQKILENFSATIDLDRIPG